MGGGVTKTTRNHLCNSYVNAMSKSDHECITMILNDPNFNINTVYNGVPLCFYLLVAVYKENFDWDILESVRKLINVKGKSKKQLSLTYKGEVYKICEKDENVLSIIDIPQNVEFMHFLYSLMARYSGDESTTYYYECIKYIINRLNATEEIEEQEENEETEDDEIPVAQVVSSGKMAYHPYNPETW